MANTESSNIMDNLVNAQKQVVDTLLENSKKITNGNTVINETIKKGTDWYKNWLEDQKNIYSKTTEQASAAGENLKDNASKLNEFYQNWLNAQMNWSKQLWEMNQDFMKNNNPAAAGTNPMNSYYNWMNQFNNWMNNMNSSNNMMNQFTQWQNQMQNQMQSNNPFSTETWTKAGENWSKMLNQYSDLMNNTFTDWQKNFQSGNVQDAYRNMVNVADGFTKFSEMWAPMWKSIQDNSFSTEQYKKFMNPSMYKEMMDKYFGFMPENARQYVQNMNDMMTGGMKQMGQMGVNNFQQMRGMMNTMPGFNGQEYFATMLNAYNEMQNMMNNAYSPIAKFITPNQYTKNAAEWSDIANRIMVYNIKNSELQYLIYSQGAKVMDSLAENVAEKVKNGVEINSMMALYQEWLSISDKSFVSLFEGDEYSKLMAEVSAMQLTLRKDVELQMEKLMTGIPVATRSEMDEMYKTIYDLKKQVRQLEKMMELESEEVIEEKTTAKKAKK
jgi:polyhydroxyalkanoate synthesis regulator phasin